MRRFEQLRLIARNRSQRCGVVGEARYRRDISPRRFERCTAIRHAHVDRSSRWRLSRLRTAAAATRDRRNESRSCRNDWGSTGDEGGSESANDLENITHLSRCRGAVPPP